MDGQWPLNLGHAHKILIEKSEARVHSDAKIRILCKQNPRLEKGSPGPYLEIALQSYLYLALPLISLFKGLNQIIVNLLIIK